VLVLKEREVLKRARGPVGYNVGSTDSGRLNKLSKEPLTWRRSPIVALRAGSFLLVPALTKNQARRKLYPDLSYPD
jgi:hypothetical protein